MNFSLCNNTKKTTQIILYFWSMKKLLIFFVLIPLLGFSKIDTTFNAQKEAVSISQEGINDLLSKYKRILLERNGIDGWRLQIKFDCEPRLVIRNRHQPTPRRKPKAHPAVR